MENEIQNFKPVGALVFFLMLLVLAAVIWFGIYYMMLDKI